MNSYGCTAYADTHEDPRWHLANVPDEYALRIDLDYSDGRKTVLLYSETPEQEEQKKLMWQLQTTAKANGFAITRTECGNEPIKVPALG